ncbi:hypothetical protein Fcan01_08551, partial [Folsomia candida]
RAAAIHIFCLTLSTSQPKITFLATRGKIICPAKRRHKADIFPAGSIQVSYLEKADATTKQVWAEEQTAVDGNMEAGWKEKGIKNLPHSATSSHSILGDDKHSSSCTTFSLAPHLVSTFSTHSAAFAKVSLTTVPTSTVISEGEECQGQGGSSSGGGHRQRHSKEVLEKHLLVRQPQNLENSDLSKLQQEIPHEEDLLLRSKYCQRVRLQRTLIYGLTVVVKVTFVADVTFLAARGGGGIRTVQCFHCIWYPNPELTSAKNASEICRQHSFKLPMIIESCELGCVVSAVHTTALSTYTRRVLMALFCFVTSSFPAKFPESKAELREEFVLLLAFHQFRFLILFGQLVEGVRVDFIPCAICSIHCLISSLSLICGAHVSWLNEDKLRGEKEAGLIRHRRPAQDSADVHEKFPFEGFTFVVGRDVLGHSVDLIQWTHNGA